MLGPHMTLNSTPCSGPKGRLRCWALAVTQRKEDRKGVVLGPGVLLLISFCPKQNKFPEVKVPRMTETPGLQGHWVPQSSHHRPREAPQSLSPAWGCFPAPEPGIEFTEGADCRQRLSRCTGPRSTCWHRCGGHPGCRGGAVRVGFLGEAEASSTKNPWGGQMPSEGRSLSTLPLSFIFSTIEKKKKNNFQNHIQTQMSTTPN